MLQPARAVEVAETFDLGGQAVLTGPVAAGRLGDVWRLSSERGDYAVKDARFPVDPAEVAADAADPAGELGVVLFAFGLGDPGRMRDLFASYVAAGGPARLEAPGDLTMLIAQSGHGLLRGLGDRLQPG
jgi:hypothetical protein